MVCIFSYFCLYAPHLKVFNLSNQNCSLPQNSRVAAFRHPCPVILAKSPRFPYLSFVPQNPPFDHFSSTASSLARTPFDEWRNHHPSHLHVRTHKPLAKVLASIFTSNDPSAAAAADIPPTVPASSSSAESETTENRNVGTSSSDLTAEEITGNAEATALLPSASQSPTCDTSRKVLRVMGSQDMEAFILKLKAERLGEVAALAELYPVSQFAFRSQIQDIFIVSEGKKTSIQEQYAESDECNWLTQSSYSRRGCGAIRRDFHNGLHKTIFIKDKGLKELLITQEKGKEKCISFPLPTQMLQTSKSWKSSSSTYSSPFSMQEGEDVIDLKYGIAQLHYEIYELRKLVESCLNFQKNLGLLIKDEVFSAINQLGERDNILQNSRNTQERQNICCICQEAQVDALLYRCGHMCACYKCGQELELRRDSCPICRSVIDDVVRAYQNP